MAAETLRPTAELSDVGLVANDHTNHNADPDSDSTTVNATGNNVNTEWGGDFATPSGNPTIGVDLQEFRAGVIEFDSGQTGTPQARIELWENGSLVRAGTDTDVSTFAVLSFTWNANELATADGSLVQMKVIGTRSGGAPTSRNTVRIGHMEWNADVAGGATQTLTPSLYTDADTFFAPTVELNLAPGLYVDPDTFFTHTLTFDQTLTAGLYVDPDTFFTPLLTVHIAPTLYVDADVFFAPTVELNLAPGLFVNTPVFFAPTVELNLVAGLYVDLDTFHSPTVTQPGSPQSLNPSLYVDPDTFFTPLLTLHLTVPLYVDADTFFSLDVELNLAPGLYVDPDTFFSPTVTPGAVTLTPSLYVDADVFFVPVVGLNLLVDLFTDPDTFYSSTVVGGGAPDQTLIIPILPSVSVVFSPEVVQNIQPALFVDADVFYSPLLMLNIFPPFYQDADTFPAHTLTLGPALQSLTVPLLADGDTIFAHIVTPSGPTLLPSLFVDIDLIHAHKVFQLQTLVAPLVVDADIIHDPQIFSGTVVLTAPLLDDSVDTFYTLTATLGPPPLATLIPPLFIDADAFFAPTLTGGSQILEDDLATTTTELEAINAILDNSALTQVNSITGSLTTEVARAVSALSDMSREVQLRGWYFNTEKEFPFVPDINNEIAVADNIAEIEFDTRYFGRWEPVVRGLRLYDKLNHKFNSFTETLKARVVLLFDFEELPQPLREYVKIRAARKYQDDFMGDGESHKFDMDDELRALAAAKFHDNRTAARQFNKPMQYSSPSYVRGPSFRN